MGTTIYETLFVVYGVSDCPHCLWACADLMEAGIPYMFVNLDFAQDYHESFKRKFNWTTFPIVAKVVDGKEVLVGGYEQLKDCMK